MFSNVSIQISALRCWWIDWREAERHQHVCWDNGLTLILGRKSIVEPRSPHSCAFTTKKIQSSVLPTLRFSHEFGLVFLWSCVFLMTCNWCFCDCFIWHLLVLCRFLFSYCFFQILWNFCCFNILKNAIWMCHCVNLLILDFSDLPACFCLWFTWLFFVLLNFPTKRIWAFIGLPIMGLFFRFTCLFLQNNLAIISRYLCDISH